MNEDWISDPRRCRGHTLWIKSYKVGGSDDDALLYSTVTPCYCSMLGMLRKWRNNDKK